jgi:ribosomal protein S18 acetylase RimI-like enzyme
MIVFTRDKQRLKDHFEKDPVLFDYHLGDLDDFHFPHCQWATVYGERPYIEDCVLVYTGLDTPTVLAFGLTDKFSHLLGELIELLPDRFFAHFQDPALPIFQRAYSYKPLGRHIKMSLDAFVPFENETRAGNIVRLDESHAEPLGELFAVAYPGNYYTPRMLATGKYFGYIDNGRLVCVAGVHVDAAEYRIAALGNITTHPDRRGESLATLVTSRLISELVAEGRRVCLNVAEDNAPAIHCYEKLGFVKVHTYLEGVFERR